MSAAHERLAIEGSTPVRKTLLPYGRQSLDETDIAAVVEVLRSDWLTTGHGWLSLSVRLPTQLGRVRPWR